MLPSIGLQRVGHDLTTKQQQQIDLLRTAISTVNHFLFFFFSFLKQAWNLEGVSKYSDG